MLPIKKFVYLLATSTLLTSCTAQLREDVDRLDASLSDLRSSFAEQSTAVSSLQSDIKFIKGKIEELEYSQDKRIGSEVDSLKNALSTLKRRVPPPPIVPASILDDDEKMASSFPQTISSRFSEALGSIREGNFSDSVPLLQSVLDALQGENQTYAPTVIFWLGVSYDGLNDNRNSLLAYNQIISVYANSNRVPLALLRQANVFSRLGDMNASILTLKKLATDYPKTAESAIAQQKLREINQGKRF